VFPAGPRRRFDVVYCTFTMLELPEIRTIAAQARELLVGKTIERAELLTPEKKFVFSSPKGGAFGRRLEGRSIRRIRTYGNHLFLVTDTGVTLNIGDTGGKLLYHTDDKTVPAKRDLEIRFDDRTRLTHSVVMWGFIAAQTEAEHNESLGKLAREAREPDRGAATVDELVAYLAEEKDRERLSAKRLVVSRKFFTGLGNGYAQDVLWLSGIHPRRKVSTLTEDEARRFFNSFLDVVENATKLGGRTSERNLLNEPGGYEPVMHRGALGKPCPRCAAPVEKFAFEGGACYICPRCQRLE